MTRDEFLSIVYDELSSDETNDRANRIIDAADCIEDAHDGCEWCKPGENGDYTMSMFQNPNNPEQKATLAVYGGEIVMEITMTADAPPARMAIKTNYCPMCGRKFTDGGDDNEQR